LKEMQVDLLDADATRDVAEEIAGRFGSAMWFTTPA